MQLAEWLAARPAAIAGLAGRKGAIREGLDADLVIWDPYERANTSAAGWYHRHALTPFHGAALDGHVAATFVRGAVVFNESAGGIWDKWMCGQALSVSN